MPAKSKAFRRLVALAEHHPEEVSEKNKGVLSMKPDDMHEFASTPEEGLPMHAKKFKGLMGKKSRAL